MPQGGPNSWNWGGRRMAGRCVLRHTCMTVTKRVPKRVPLFPRGLLSVLPQRHPGAQQWHTPAGAQGRHPLPKGKRAPVSNDP